MRLSNKIKVALRTLIMKCGSVSTDKGEVQFDGDELVVGTEVFITDESGETVEAPDGTYVADDKEFDVAEGKVTEIREKSDEGEGEGEAEFSSTRAKFNSMKALFEESYEEKIQKIAEAVRAAGYPDSWIVEASDTYAVAEVWNEEKGDYDLIRFDVAFDEEGNVTVSNPTEVKPTYEPVEENFEDVTPADDEGKEDTTEPKSNEDRLADLEAGIGEIREGIEALTNAIAAVVSRVEAVEEKIKGLEEPAGEPAEEGEETESVASSKLSYLKRK